MDGILDLPMDRGPRRHQSRGSVVSAGNKKSPEQAAVAFSGTPDLASLRLPQDFAANLGVKKMLVQVPVTKPRKGWFVRTRPGDGWRAQIAMIERKEEGENYVVSPELAADLTSDVKQYMLVTSINRHGSAFLWPARLPNGSRQDSWADSALMAVAHAEAQWLRVDANMRAGAYDVSIATAPLPEPEWPEESFDALFRLAFRDMVISSLDHPVIRQLRGAA